MNEGCLEKKVRGEFALPAKLDEPPNGSSETVDVDASFKQSDVDEFGGLLSQFSGPHGPDPALEDAGKLERGANILAIPPHSDAARSDSMASPPSL